MGRPPKYDPAMCEVVVELGAEGKSVAQICADIRIDVAISTFYEWVKTHPDFSEAVTRAKNLSLAWWEDAGQRGMFLGGGGFNANAYSLQIRNRFPTDYSDRKDLRLGGENGGAVRVQIEREVVDPPEREDPTQQGDSNAAA